LICNSCYRLASNVKLSTFYKSLRDNNIKAHAVSDKKCLWKAARKEGEGIIGKYGTQKTNKSKRK